MADLINATEHEITISHSVGKHVKHTIPPSGLVARILSRFVKIKTVNGIDIFEEEKEIFFFHLKDGEIDWSKKIDFRDKMHEILGKNPNCYVIVSKLTKETAIHSCSKRIYKNLVYPESIVKQDGQILYARMLVC